MNGKRVTTNVESRGPGKKGKTRPTPEALDDKEGTNPKSEPGTERDKNTVERVVTNHDSQHQITNADNQNIPMGEAEREGD